MTAPMMPPVVPAVMPAVLHGPAAVSLAVLSGSLMQAMSRSDMVEVLIAAAELDRMVRNLGPVAETPEDRAALLRAHAVVNDVLATLELELDRAKADRRRNTRLRLAYALEDAA